MEALPKPDVILTHESDLDGLLAGALLQKLVKKLFGTDIPLEAHHYNFWKQRELRERAAWVTDFTFETRMDRQDWSSLTITSRKSRRKTRGSSTTSTNPPGFCATNFAKNTASVHLHLISLFT